MHIYVRFWSRVEPCAYVFISTFKSSRHRHLDDHPNILLVSSCNRAWRWLHLGIILPSMGPHSRNNWPNGPVVTKHGHRPDIILASSCDLAWRWPSSWYHPVAPGLKVAKSSKTEIFLEKGPEGEFDLLIILAYRMNHPMLTSRPGIVQQVMEGSTFRAFQASNMGSELRKNCYSGKTGYDYECRRYNYECCRYNYKCRIYSYKCRRYYLNAADMITNFADMITNAA